MGFECGNVSYPKHSLLLQQRLNGENPAKRPEQEESAFQLCLAHPHNRAVTAGRQSNDKQRTVRLLQLLLLQMELLQLLELLELLLLQILLLDPPSGFDETGVLRFLCAPFFEGIVDGNKQGVDKKVG